MKNFFIAVNSFSEWRKTAPTLVQNGSDNTKHRNNIRVVERQCFSAGKIDPRTTMNYPRVYSPALWFWFPGARPIEVVIQKNAKAKATEKHASEHYHYRLTDSRLH